MVVDHHVGARQDGFTPPGQESRITRPGPDQIDFPHSTAMQDPLAEDGDGGPESRTTRHKCTVAFD